MDLDGEWSWLKATRKELLEVHNRLKQFEAMRWSEIVGDENHDNDISGFSKSARKRLSKIHLEDIDSLFSLKISKKKRAYGIRDRHILKILWWDPEHTAYPTEKKHT